jgi:hypothetical protein
MKRLIQLPQFNDLTPLPVMNQVFRELTEGFTDYNCTIKIVTSLDHLEDDGIIFLDNYAGNYINYKEIYMEIGKKCPNSIFICWYWDKDDSFRPFQYMIHTGEYYINKTVDIYQHYDYMMRPDFVPFKLRASESPDKIGLYERKIERDYCFMGGGYKMDWIPKEFNGLYHRVIYDNYLSYEERRTIYLSSIFAFGFQSDGNILTGHLSQRIFEGLAYGCIVLCENKLASIFTDGTVIYVSSKEDLIEKMKYYKEHPEEIIKLQQKGYEWVKKYGTNRLTIQNFLDKIKSMFYKEFDPISSPLHSIINKIEFKENKEDRVEENREMSKPIVSVNIMGGLGNQFFQIATAYAYARKENAQLQIIHKLENGNRPVYWNTLLKKIQPYLVSSLPQLPVWSEMYPTMYKEIGPIPRQGIYLTGYLQSSKYFYNNDIKNEIKELFHPDDSIINNVINRYHFLIDMKENVVVLHARRTDYILHSEVHGPLTSYYYKEAVERISKKIKNPIFVLTSDDNQYWSQIREHIPIVFSNPYIILENESDIHTFSLLQQFENFIMSNSTFIWWCVYLANAKNVIAPSKWFGPKGPNLFHDIFEENWELI